MKVLFLTNIPSPYRVDFFNELGKKCSLTVLFENRNEQHRKETWCNYCFDGFKAVFLHGKRVFGKKVCTEVKHYLNEGFDAIIITNYNTPTGIFAIRCLKNKKIPFIISVDGGFIREFEPKYKRWLKKYLIGSATYWFSTSNASDDYLVFYGADKKRVYRYPFTSIFENDLVLAQELVKNKKQLKKEIGVSEELMVLTVGRFNLNGGYGKGFDAVMRMAERCRKQDIGFCIVGDDPTEEFVGWKEKHNLSHIHFYGFQDKESLKRFYAAADVFVLMTRSDVWGLVLNEAMSFSLPVITTEKCVAGLELIKDGFNGAIVRVNDDSTATKKLLDICFGGDFEQFRENSFKTICEYTIENMAQQHIRLLESIYEKQLQSNKTE